ncbi:hypothetical protein [Vibrio coralliirubri]|uniref:hypothetical protein n=1 Tax=Vibrio coralliirubri TaxID=1516159 RepID=UPI000630C1CA|nr:hypothetical protein [Vibrio coralliirubri]CDT32170.1 hypothetical protein VCR6J2_360159 [Vibrio coralliirubri]
MPKVSQEELDFRQRFDAAATFATMKVAQCLYNDDLQKLNSIKNKFVIRNIHHCQHDHFFAADVLTGIQTILSRGGMLSTQYNSLTEDLGSLLEYQELTYVIPLSKYARDYFDFIFEAVSKVNDLVDDEIRLLEQDEIGSYLYELLLAVFHKYLNTVPVIDIHLITHILSKSVWGNRPYKLSDIQLRSIVNLYLDKRNEDQRNALVNFAIHDHIAECRNLEINIGKDIPWWLIIEIRMTPLILLRMFAASTKDILVEVNKLEPFLDLIRRRIWSINSSKLNDAVVSKVKLETTKSGSKITIDIKENISFNSMKEESAKELLDNINKQMNYLILSNQYRGRETYKCAYFKRNDSIKSYIAALASISLEEYSKIKGTKAYSIQPNMSFDRAFDIVNDEMIKLGIAYKKDGYEQVRKKRKLVKSTIESIQHQYGMVV